MQNFCEHSPSLEHSVEYYQNSYCSYCGERVEDPEYLAAQNHIEKVKINREEEQTEVENLLSEALICLTAVVRDPENITVKTLSRVSKLLDRLEKKVYGS